MESGSDGGQLATYESAFAAWKNLGAGRSVGRPANADGASLTSTERAKQARARQQQAAQRWELVAPIVQQLRRAVKAEDAASIASIAGKLVRQTEMALSNAQVVHAQPDTDQVVIHAWHGSEMVLAIVPTSQLEDYFHRAKRLNGKEANLLVDRNLDAIARIVSAKFERGEYKPYARFNSTLPCVELNLQDLEQSDEKLTDSVLDTQFVWADVR